MSISRNPLALATGLWLGAQVASASILHVPVDYPTVQSAIDAASPGDIIRVAPGVYLENLDFLGKSIRLESEQGPDATILDGGALGSVVAFASNEGRSAVLKGFTIRNGDGKITPYCFGDGGGICIQESSPTVEDNVIVDNVACEGHGIAIRAGSPLIQRNLIARNTNSTCSSGTGGGGIVVHNGPQPVIRRNIIADNVTVGDGGGIALLGTPAYPIVEGNIIFRNVSDGLGGGISLVNGTAALIVNNLIAENQGDEGGGVGWLIPDNAEGPRLINNTIVDNDSVNGSAVWTDGYDDGAVLVNNLIIGRSGQTALECGSRGSFGAPTMRFNNVFSHAAPAYGALCTDLTGVDGNIKAPPMFVDEPNKNYRLQKSSQSVDAGLNGVQGIPVTDLSGIPRVLDGNVDGTAIIDMGAYETAVSLCNVSLGFDRGTLTMRFDVQPDSPVTWYVFLVALGQPFPLWSLPLPPLDSPVSPQLPIPNFPPLGELAVVSLFATPTEGLVCIDTDRIGTGGPGLSGDSTRHLLLRSGLATR